MKTRATDFESSSIEETAADWLVRRRDGLAPDLEAKYQSWLAGDSRHAAAIAELEATWDEVSFPAMAGRATEAARILDRRAAAKRSRPYIIAAAGLAVAVLMFAVFPLHSPSRADLSTVAVTVRPNIETLPDGSTVELNAGAEIAIDYTSERRNVRLVRGEALFSVTRNVARPFVVFVQGVEVRAVGTAFAVRRETDEVGILVTEGRVVVERRAPSDPSGSGHTESVPSDHPIYLDAGGRVEVAVDYSIDTPPPAVRSLSAAEIGAALAWRGKRVEFSRMSLSDAAALFNKHNRVQLSISDNATATIPISGIFWSDDPEGFVRLLESGLGVRSERSGGTVVLSSR